MDIGLMGQLVTDTLKLNANNDVRKKSYFLVSFFNFFYYLLFIPFKTEFDENGDRYRLKAFRLQQIFCAIVQVGSILYISAETWKVVTEIESYETTCIVTIFDVVSCVGCIASAVFMVVMVWWHRDEYLKVIECTRFQEAATRRAKFNKILLNLAMVALFIFIAIVTWFMIKSHQSHVQLDNQIRSNMTSLGRRNLTEGVNDDVDLEQNENKVLNRTCKKCQQNKSMLNAGGEVTVPETSLVSQLYLHVVTQNLLMLMRTYFSLLYSACHIVFFALALTLRQIGIEFVHNLTAAGFGEDGVKKGVVLYKQLKHCMTLIRNVFGNALLGFYIAAVSYLAEAPHILMGKRGETEKLLMVYFCISGVVWILAAEFHAKVSTAVQHWADWLYYDNDQPTLTTDDRLMLMKISNELSSYDLNTIALSNKCFPVTYKHLSSMLGLILTYGILVFQLHST